jgi:hypothetical protein
MVTTPVQQHCQKMSAGFSSTDPKKGEMSAGLASTDLRDFFRNVLFLKRSFFVKANKFYRFDELLSGKVNRQFADDFQLGIGNFGDKAKLIVITHLWEDKMQPDPLSAQFHNIKKFVCDHDDFFKINRAMALIEEECDSTRSLSVTQSHAERMMELLADVPTDAIFFYDFTSLPQKQKGEAAGTFIPCGKFTQAELKMIFDNALGHMVDLYSGRVVRQGQTVVFDANAGPKYCHTRSWPYFELLCASVFDVLVTPQFGVVPPTWRSVLYFIDFVAYGAFASLDEAENSLRDAYFPSSVAMQFATIKMNMMTMLASAEHAATVVDQFEAQSVVRLSFGADDSVQSKAEKILRMVSCRKYIHIPIPVVTEEGAFESMIDMLVDIAVHGSVLAIRDTTVTCEGDRQVVCRQWIAQEPKIRELLTQRCASFTVYGRKDVESLGTPDELGLTRVTRSMFARESDITSTRPDAGMLCSNDNDDENGDNGDDDDNSDDKNKTLTFKLRNMSS